MRRWFTVPVTLFGLAVAPLNAGGAVLFVYAAASAGGSESRRTALRWMVGLTVLWGVYGTVLFALTRIVMPWGLWAFLPPLLYIWVIGLWVIESAEREQAAAELRIRHAHVGHLATMEGAIAASAPASDRAAALTAALLVGFDFAVREGFLHILGAPPVGAEHDRLAEMLTGSAAPAPPLLGRVLAAAWRAALVAVAEGAEPQQAHAALLAFELRIPS